MEAILFFVIAALVLLVVAGGRGSLAGDRTEALERAIREYEEAEARGEVPERLRTQEHPAFDLHAGLVAAGL